MADEVALLSCGDVVTEIDPADGEGGAARRRRSGTRCTGEVPYWRAVQWVATRPDGAVEFGYSGKRDPYLLPAISEVTA